MSNNYLSMWSSVICSTVWAANDGMFGMAIWLVSALIYGILATKEN